MNHWEQKLRTWTPRRPSDELRRRIFSKSQANPAPEPGDEMRFGWMGWLTPATAAAAVLAGVLSSTTLPLPRVMAGEDRAALAALNDRCQQSTWNHVRAETLKWTNSALPHSTNASLNAVN